MESLVYINGEILRPEQAKVSVFDRGFLFGDGVYETGRSYQRCPLFMEEHQARLRRSAEKLLIPVPWSDRELRDGLFETARRFGKPDIYFRTIVTRGRIDYVGLDVFADNPPTLVHIIQNLSSKIARIQVEGVKLLTSRVLRNPTRAQDPNIKTSNYLNSLLAFQDIKARGGDDAVLCDREGNVTEGTTFSIFGVTCAKTIITPSLEVGILDSITRRHLLSLATAFAEVKEGYFKKSDFLECPEVFIASSVREIVPVNVWDERRFQSPGPVTQQLQQKLRDEIQVYVASHEKF